MFTPKWKVGINLKIWNLICKISLNVTGHAMFPAATRPTYKLTNNKHNINRVTNKILKPST